MTKGSEPATGFGFTTADGQSHVLENGLTKREYFAAMAMQGLCSNHLVYDIVTDEQLANVAVINADALINALNTTT